MIKSSPRDLPSTLSRCECSGLRRPPIRLRRRRPKTGCAAWPLDAFEWAFPGRHRAPTLEELKRAYLYDSAEAGAEEQMQFWRMIWASVARARARRLGRRDARPPLRETEASKLMKESQLKKRTCSQCGITVPLSARAFPYCGGCRRSSVPRKDRPRFCGFGCQRAHWVAGHMHECPCTHLDSTVNFLSPEWIFGSSGLEIDK